MEFHIKHTWDSLPVDHEPVKIHFSPVTAPFFNHPPAPAGPPGEPFPGLWDYEVVESFFLNNNTEQYLEVEQEDLSFLMSNIEDNKWKGEALLPWRYFPQGINKMNSYAIHGSGAGRTYEALYPVPREDLQEGQGPDFHQLEYFQDFTLQSIMGDDWVQPESDLWDLASK
uniref:Chromosome 4 open reading frame 33 n=2 Tax=Cyprinus carpio TaxID=7962 RepID=A0A9J7ZB79_CYPCA